MILTGDCIEVMQGMEPDSVDSIVTDPPYGLAFMGKEWDTLTPQRFGSWCCEWGTQALRVAKSGGYLLAFGGTRTHHRLVCGLEDAGWIIRDELDWIYASGFPKGKANLKPAHEPIVLARKPGPLQPLAIDACRIGTDGGGTHCPHWPEPCRGHGGDGRTWDTVHVGGPATTFDDPVHGRWPSNLLLSDPALFDERNAEVVGSGATVSSGEHLPHYTRSAFGGNGLTHGEMKAVNGEGYGDSGGYSRFFIIPKADRADREPVLRGQLNGEKAADYPSQRGKTNRENAHPTVKPVDLMRHLVRLVTPAGGTVLDCFLGSGSTALAAELEGLGWIGIEKEPEYVKIAEARLHYTQIGMGL